MECKAYAPQQYLKRLSFDQQITHVLRTPNRIKYKKNQFEGWQNEKEYSLQKKQKRANQILRAKNQKTNFKISSQKSKISSNNKNNEKTGKENKNELSFFEDKVIKMVDEMIISPKSRKLLTPKKAKRNPQQIYASQKINKIYETPTYESFCNDNKQKNWSLKKFCMSERMNKDYTYSQNRIKYSHQDQQIENCQYMTKTQGEFKETHPSIIKDVNNYESQIGNNETNRFKIQLSSIVYPMEKYGAKKSFRRIERFHSFVARTVRR